MTHRPLISVFSTDKTQETAQIELPAVFHSPIRPDLVRQVHTNIRKNHRQAYAVSRKAGHQVSAASWGTGRAVSRIPRVAGSGTSRSGQGAYGNMCRGGHMFNPTKTWRRWHRRVNLNERRYAIVSALAASAVPALVMARGHRIAEVAQVPLVVDDSLESVEKTQKALSVLKQVGGFQDAEKAKLSRSIRAGKGKARNRRYVVRRGPLIVYNEDKGLVKAFRNLPGVDLCCVTRLNVLQLAPGGHLGRFIIWTKSALEHLNTLYGSRSEPAQDKAAYSLPHSLLTQSDLSRIINSDEIQSAIRPSRPPAPRLPRKKNALKNIGVMRRLNPYGLAQRRRQIVKERCSTKGGGKRMDEKRIRSQKRAMFKRLVE